KELEIWNGKKLTKSEASSMSGIANIMWEEDFDKTLNEIIHPISTIYLNIPENLKSSPEIKTAEIRLAEKIISRFPLHHKERLAPMLAALRLLKEPEEINTIHYACTITGNAFKRVLSFIKPGVHEYEVEAELTHEFIKSGAMGHAYQPIVASGENACFLHYITNRSKCNDGDLLLMDFGAEYANYASDCSRTIPVNGRFTPRQRDIYDATYRVFQKAKQLMVKGTSIMHIQKHVCNLWEEEHIRLGLYSAEDLRHQDPDEPLHQRYYMHGISHFMGLDVHDPGNKNLVLEAGMVLTCEPGIYIREEGIGIRLENDILITQDEPIDLMQHIPIEAEEIEELMNKH
ncbi:MAG TPA: M24 family metallopeptidase, partial [Bacteroidales bacterium]|nr:M24 family metallopeptidase [Bacteroidales bacterium]